MKRRWRDYRTPSGRRPVRDFIAGLSDADAASVLAGLSEVRETGLEAARHLRGDIWEVRVDGERAIYRILFAPEGRGRVLLSLHAFKKKTRRTPPEAIRLAERRLRSWRARANES